MKVLNVQTIAHRFLLLAVLSALIMFSGCGDDEPSASKQDQVRELLTASPWKMTSILVDGVDQSDVYKPMVLTFSNTTYITVDGGVVWPASGTWTFTSEDATAIKRGDDLVVTLQEVTATSLKLSLTWDKNTIGSGRQSSVSGQHVYTFGK